MCSDSSLPWTKTIQNHSTICCMNDQRHQTKKKAERAKSILQYIHIHFSLDVLGRPTRSSFSTRYPPQKPHFASDMRTSRDTRTASPGFETRNNSVRKALYKSDISPSENQLSVHLGIVVRSSVELEEHRHQALPSRHGIFAVFEIVFPVCLEIEDVFCVSVYFIIGRSSSILS